MAIHNNREGGNSHIQNALNFINDKIDTVKGKAQESYSKTKEKAEGLWNNNKYVLFLRGKKAPDIVQQGRQSNGFGVGELRPPSLRSANVSKAAKGRMEDMLKDAKEGMKKGNIPWGNKKDPSVNAQRGGPIAGKPRLQAKMESLTDQVNALKADFIRVSTDFNKKIEEVGPENITQEEADEIEAKTKQFNTDLSTLLSQVNQVADQLGDNK